jgi:hypothetical protein
MQRPIWGAKTQITPAGETSPASVSRGTLIDVVENDGRRLAEVATRINLQLIQGPFALSLSKGCLAF